MYFKNKLPSNFVFLKTVDPTIIENVRYATTQNFLNKVVTGYSSNNIICTKEAAEKLKLVHDDLKKHGYMLVVYDGYRPQDAVNEFVKWQKRGDNQEAKERYYPTVNKEDIFKLGYVVGKSSHSRGSTFDLTIIKIGEKIKPVIFSKKLLTNNEVIPFLDDNTIDMGSSFDLFHEVSHHDTNLITFEQTEMRNLLRNTMKKYGFKEYQQEWWHYTLENEPYPDTYFNFIVK